MVKRGCDRTVNSVTSREFHPCTVPVQPPNAVTRSRREYHYACPFSSRIAHHRPCKRFPIHSEYHFRLLAPLCCSRTNVCSQTIGYLIFKEHLPQQPGSASDASFRVKSRRMLSIMLRSLPDNVFDNRFNKCRCSKFKYFRSSRYPSAIFTPPLYLPRIVTIG